MQRTGVATLPLHSGKAPRWLFKRMVALSKEITKIIVYEYGADELLRRLSDPFWFQAFSCVLGYDWHSSGTTTVTCGALKEAINPMDLGVTLAGGKGKASQHTLEEIQIYGENCNLSTSLIDRLKYCSRMTAKVDNSAIQDGHTLYHHVFFVSETKHWMVIQQGMNDTTGFARRYHWLSEDVDNFVCEPHTAIVGEDPHKNVLNMTALQSTAAQKVCVDLINDNPGHLKEDWASLSRHQNQTTLDDWPDQHRNNIPIAHLNMPRSINWEKIKQIYDVHPTNYEEFLAMKGVGPMVVRALALISDLVYGEKPSWDDPIRYTFAHGGKDGVPHPVDLPTYAATIQLLEDALKQATIGQRERLQALKRLKNMQPPVPLHPFILCSHH